MIGKYILCVYNSSKLVKKNVILGTYNITFSQTPWGTYKQEIIVVAYIYTEIASQPWSNTKPKADEFPVFLAYLPSILSKWKYKKWEMKINKNTELGTSYYNSQGLKYINTK